MPLISSSLEHAHLHKVDHTHATKHMPFMLDLPILVSLSTSSQTAQWVRSTILRKKHQITLGVSPRLGQLQSVTTGTIFLRLSLIHINNTGVQMVVTPERINQEFSQCPVLMTLHKEHHLRCRRYQLCTI